MSNSNLFSEWNLRNESDFMEVNGKEESRDSKQVSSQHQEEPMANGEKRKREEVSEECNQTKFTHKYPSPWVFTIRTKSDCERFVEQSKFILHSHTNTLVVVSPSLTSSIPPTSKFCCVIMDMAANDISLQSNCYAENILNTDNSCDVGKLFLHIQRFSPKSIVFMIKTEAKTGVLEQTISSMENLRIIDISTINENVNFLIEEQSHSLFAKVSYGVELFHLQSSIFVHT